MNGRINSFQSLGTVDGPGIRAVVFMQGCPLRCVCCHNPETWSFDGGTEITSDTIFDKILRCKNYFGQQGGVTVSGGEPLMQPEFVTEIFSLSHKNGINTVLDTSGCVINENVKMLLEKTDLVLLDYKYTNDEDYLKYTKCEKSRADDFLALLNEMNIPVWIRQVIIPGINDNIESVIKLKSLMQKYSIIKKTELLPFRKLCSEKYKNMNIVFPLEHTPEADSNLVSELEKLVNS